MVETIAASTALLVFFIVTFFFNIIIACIAKSRGRSWIGWFVISLLIDPILALILVLVLDRKN